MNYVIALTVMLLVYIIFQKAYRIFQKRIDSDSYYTWQKYNKEDD